MCRTPGARPGSSPSTMACGWDSYYGKQSLSPDTVKKKYLSPRVNLAYAFTRATTLRLNYDKLFSQPPLAQGAILGTNLVPQTTDMYEIGLDHRLTPLQNIKVSLLLQERSQRVRHGAADPVHAVRRVHDPAIHIAGGSTASSCLTISRHAATSAWADFSPTPTPSPSRAALDQTGAPAPIVNDHDQLNTLSAGRLLHAAVPGVRRPRHLLRQRRGIQLYWEPDQRQQQQPGEQRLTQLALLGRPAPGPPASTGSGRGWRWTWRT